MINLNDYFKPIEKGTLLIDEHILSSNLLSQVSFNTSKTPINKLTDYNIAIFGVEEDRNSFNKGCSIAPDKIRDKLYSLARLPQKAKIIDLGNLISGNTVNDTYFAIKEIVAELAKHKVIPVIIGGSQDITYGNYLAYELLEQNVNLVTVDSRLDIGNPDADINSYSYINKIILKEENHLFNYSNIGFQSHFVADNESDLMKKLLFDSYRLGMLKEDMQHVEPALRDADIVSIDISSIRQSDAPGNKNVSPNGLYAEQACQLSKFAGMSDKVSSFGIYEVNPELDNNNQTSHLAAQIIWYFIDGVCNRKNDFPFSPIENYQKFVVNMTTEDQDITFYKSPSERWWLAVPFPKGDRKRNIIVACSYTDYKKACKQELPDRWWKTFQKIS